MEKTLKEKQAAQFELQLHALIGYATFVQKTADRALTLAGDFMTDAEQEDSDVLRVTGSLSFVCGEALQVLRAELQKGTRLSERLCNKNQFTSFNTFNHGTEK